MDGEYRVTNIKPGKYTLAFSYIGFLTEKTEIEIGAGEIKKFDMSLVFDAVDIGEVVVSVQILGQAKALNQQLNSDALVSVVSSDKMEELPDVNAAEAIGRLPGISVTRSGGEASKVTVRGLSPKLTSITINGVKVASTSNGVDDSDRSVDLSMISPELLSSIEVYKSPTADMDGDAIGGIVNLGVSKAPDKPGAKIRTSGGYNGLTNKFSNYKGSVDLSKRFYEGKLGLIGQLSYENVNRSSQTISNFFDDSQYEYEEWAFKSATIRQDLRTIKRMGGNLTADYKYNSGFVVGQGFFSQRNGETLKNENRIYHGEEIRHLPSHTKSEQYTYQGVLSGQQRVSIVSMDWTLARSQTVNDNLYDVNMYLLEPEGSSRGTTAEEQYVISTEELLQTRVYNYEKGYLNQYNWEPEKSKQNNTTAALDFKTDYSFGDKIAGFVKVGGKYRIEDRSNKHNHQTVLSYYNDASVSDKAVQNMLPQELVTLDPGISMQNFYSKPTDLQIWDGEYLINPEIDMDYVDLWHSRNQGELYPQLDKAYKNYTLTERVSAAYIMTKINYSSWLTFIPGLRYEYSNNDYHSYYSDIIQNIAGFIENGSIRDTSSYQKYGVLLPSFHLKIKPVQWFDVRMSAVKTLARPDYSMVTPRYWLNLNKSELFRGNPNLKHAEAWSYDVTTSFFANRLGLFTVGGFYKEFDNFFAEIDYTLTEDQAIKEGYPRGAYSVNEDYANFDGSKVYGFEIDLQTNLSFLPKPFNGIVFNANITRLWSETFNPRFEKPITVIENRVTSRIYDTVGYLDKSVLPDQVELAGNVSIGYDYKGFSCRFSMIYQSPSLKKLGTAKDFKEQHEGFTAMFLRFDASLSQKIGKHVTVTANLANITSESERSYQYVEKHWTRENRYGASFNMGLQYKF
jgi:TonB-dependent receptor